MRKMRTAEEMRAYYLENVNYKRKMGFFDISDPDKDDLRYYKIAEEVLDPDEFVLTFFWGYINIYMDAPKKTDWIYLFTNKQIIARCIDYIGERKIGYMKIKNIRITSDENEIYFDIDSWYRELSDIGIEPQDAEFFKRELEEVMPYIREIQEKEAQKKKFSGSPADEIRKYKELCNDGIITEEEFEDRKRELLRFKYVD